VIANLRTDIGTVCRQCRAANLDVGTKNWIDLRGRIMTIDMAVRQRPYRRLFKDTIVEILHSRIHALLRCDNAAEETRGIDATILKKGTEVRRPDRAH
jgi:hypothetical protein